MVHEEPIGPGQHRPRVLVVDDDVAIREMCTRILEEEGYSVETACNGDEARRAFESRPASLVICDIFMPDRDGFETISGLRREYRGLKIIAMSGGSSTMLDLAKGLGADALLPKPFGTDGLLDLVRPLMS